MTRLKKQTYQDLDHGDPVDGGSCRIVLMKRDDDDRFGRNLDLLVSNYKKALDLAFVDNIDDPVGFHRRCAALRAEFDTWVNAEKQTEMARIEKRQKDTTSLESPCMAEADRSARYRDDSSGGMRTPRNAGTTSPPGFGLERSSYDEGDEDDDVDVDDTEMDEDAFEQLSRKAKKLARRTGVSEAVAFSKIYEDPKYSDLVAATKRPVVRLEKSAQDAFAGMMALAEQAYTAGKYPTAAVAFEKMLSASDAMLRESVKRARGTT